MKDYYFSNHSIEEYEKSHGPRLDFIVKDLNLNQFLKGKWAIDCGGAYGAIARRLSNVVQKTFFVVDSINFERSDNFIWQFERVDLETRDWYEPLIPPLYQVGMSFETIEHLTNPYNFLLGLKSIVEENGTIFLSIPEIATTHNVLYPGLFYPSENFDEFLGQMALKIERKVLHNVCFSQWVYTLRNLPWSESKMKFHKGEDKFRGKTPLEQINL